MSPELRKIQALLERIDLASLVPDVYADFRPAIAEGLAFFLTRLGAARRKDVCSRQAALPAGASAATRLVTLARSCPVLHKLAQVVARHPALDADLRRKLQTLEMDTLSVPWRDVAPHLPDELAGADAAFEVEVGSRTLAEGSVAVVIPCRWRRQPGAPLERAVMKILKPGVADQLVEELGVLVDLADHLDERRDAYGLPDLDHRDAFTTVRDLLRHEVHLDLEQRHLATAATLYADDPRVHIPALLPFSTPRLTAMERVDGVKVTGLPRRPDGRPTADAGVTAATLVDALVATPVLDVAPHAIFHADPHAGNLLATTDGRVAILDWSLTGRLDKEPRITITRLMMAALRQDASGVAECVAALAESAPPRGALADPIEIALRQIRSGRPPGPDWLADLLDGVVARGARFSASLLLFRKTLFTLRSVVHDVDPGCSLDAVFLARVMRRLVEEWPRRFWSSPYSRSFGTHLSSADLAGVWLSTPMAMMQTWMGRIAGR